MRRPLCVFCAGMLGVALVCDFLPQTELFVPFAAFFVAVCLLLCIPDRTRKALLCLLLGAAAGLAAARHTNARLEQTLEKYAGQTVALTAEVESVSASYYPGIVDAVLRVERVNGRAAEFWVECDTLPVCEAGERVEGRFALEAPEPADRTTLFADGVVLWAREPQAFARLGKSSSFRARTGRLQKRLSTSLRGEMNEDAGGVLAAMTVGDRNHLSSALRSAYRGAGLSHVLVVSGMHVSILCGDVLGRLLPNRKKRLRGYTGRRVRALFSAVLALLLVGVTGFTPSVLRAAGAVWLSALGVWVYGPPDALTSLGVAGVLMTAGNSCAVCDVGFQLSFAAVVGTLAGGAVVRRSQEVWEKQRAEKKHPRLRFWKRKALGLAGSLWETVCISACASMATFPVLVLRGMSATVWAVVSGVAVLWMVGPMLGLSLGAALLGLAAQNFGSLPLVEILRRPIAFCAEGLAFGMNEWAFRVSGLPGASLWFDGGYAALVCFVLFLLCAAAMRWNVRLRAALPTVVLLTALAFGLEMALSWNVVNIELVGTQAAPAVVITRREQAVVLFRGSSITQRAVETQLEKRGVKRVELLVDLRMQPETPCDLKAETRIEAAALAADTTRRAACGGMDLELYRTRQGCIVRLTIGGQRFVTVSGTVRPAKPIRAEWLLASMARPDNIRYTDCLTLSRKYRWMRESDAAPVSRLRLRLAG